MAVGRRKRFAGAGNSLSNVNGTLFTAGAAPADGSAAATVWIHLCNADTSAHTVSIFGPGGMLWWSSTIPGANTSNGAGGFVPNTVDIGPFDLMGGDAFQGVASVASVVSYYITGVEAKDS